jgi:hypothetical protein
MEESDLQLEANRALPPNLAAPEFPTEKDVPNMLIDTDPDAGALNSADDTLGAT